MGKSTTQPPKSPTANQGSDEITEAALLKAGALQSAIFNSANFSSIATDARGVIQIFNVGAERMLGYTAADVMNKLTPADLSDPQEVIARANALSLELGTPITPGFEALVFKASRGIEDIYELTYIRKDGSRFPAVVSVTALRDAQNTIIGYLLIGTDNSARKRKEGEYRTLTQTSLDGFCISDLSGRILDVNGAYCQMLGYTREEFLRLQVRDFEASESPEETAAHFQKLIRTGSDLFRTRQRRKDGAVIDVEASAQYVAELGERIFSFIRDITERKQTEAKILATQVKLQGLLAATNQSRRAMLSVIEDQKRAETAIQHTNRALAALSDVNRTLVHATDENELLPAICRAIVEQRGYRMAWVGYKQHDESKSIKIMARAGHDEGYLDVMQLTWAETERGMGASGRAIRSGATQLCQDIASDPLYFPWRDAALERGYATSIALPLNGGNAVFGILNVYAAEVNAFSPTEISLLEQMAGDLASGVNSLRIRHERDLALEQNQRQLVQLQDSLEDTMRAIASIVEMRDPYTAGHQVRVADLAAAIAKQMGLPDEQVHAIHLAGTVHDLGKIQIPAEILSKPGKITDIEFSFIKIHPQAGYDILKGIDFPWPIAQMVLQHHERLDGSGYPQGLKGEAILLEARILSVADVVEAMSSHRPYRAGLGVETALEEITKQRGIFFDPAVVDACVTLFREQNYSFKI